MGRKKCEKDPKPTGAALIKNFTLENAIYQTELGNGSFPPDTIMAIGPNIVIAMTNTLIGYFPRPSMIRSNLETMNTFFPFGALSGGGDVQVVYDEFSCRFFALAWVRAVVSANLQITAPAGIVGNYNARKFTTGPQVFSVTGNIIPTVPITAEIGGVSTITNAGAIAGNIALIQRGGTPPGNGFSAKIQAAQNAGAIEVIIFDNAVRPLPNNGGFPEATIPSIFISLADGTKILANPPVVGTISSLASDIQKNYMNIAVSKTDTPLNTNDWFKYQLTTPHWQNDNVAADYPKILVDKCRYYICTQEGDFNIPYSRNVITVLEKKPMVDGTGLNLLAQNILESPSQFIAQPARIVYSGYNKCLPAFFLTYANWGPQQDIDLVKPTHIRVYIGDSLSVYVDVPFPVITNVDVRLNAKQPGVALPLDASKEYIISAVIYKNSIFCAHTVLVGGRNVVRWYELDVKKYATKGISIKQWGDIDSCVVDESCFIPAINVDKNGNMAVVFTVSSPVKNPTFVFTGRLKNDPQGTVRKPFQVIKQSAFPYNGANTSTDSATGPVFYNRWGDYASVVVDPNDHSTFYAFGEYASDKPADIQNGLSLRWTTAMTSFNIEKSYSTLTQPSTPCLLGLNLETVSNVEVPQTMAELDISQIKPRRSRRDEEAIDE